MRYRPFNVGGYRYLSFGDAYLFSLGFKLGNYGADYPSW